VWDDEESQLLVGPVTLEERGCQACFWEVELWERILEDTGDRKYGTIAWQMIALDSYLETMPSASSNLTAWEWEFLQAVRYERRRREVQKHHNTKQEQAAKSARNKIADG
jgi:hypothetical protein